MTAPVTKLVCRAYGRTSLKHHFELKSKPFQLKRLPLPASPTCMAPRLPSWLHPGLQEGNRGAIQVGDAGSALLVAPWPPSCRNAASQSRQLIALIRAPHGALGSQRRLNSTSCRSGRAGLALLAAAGEQKGGGGLHGRKEKKCPHSRPTSRGDKAGRVAPKGALSNSHRPLFASAAIPIGFS